MSMRLIKEDLGLTAFANKGIDVAKSYGKGEFRWFADGIMVDKETGRSSNIYFYFFDQNVIIFGDFIGANQKSAIFELENNDTLEVFDEKSFSLTDIYNTASAKYVDRSFAVYATGGKAFLVISNRYIVTLGVTVSSDEGMVNLATIVITQSDLLKRTQNLVETIKKMQHGQNFQEGFYVGSTPIMTNFYTGTWLVSTYIYWIGAAIIIGLILLSIIVNIFNLG